MSTFTRDLILWAVLALPPVVGLAAMTACEIHPTPQRLTCDNREVGVLTIPDDRWESDLVGSGLTYRLRDGTRGSCRTYALTPVPAPTRPESIPGSR